MCCAAVPNACPCIARPLGAAAAAMLGHGLRATQTAAKAGARSTRDGREPGLNAALPRAAGLSAATRRPL